jgi:hypothetical protein
MLGSNALKVAYHRSADDVAMALKHYVDYVRQYCEETGMTPPRIVLVSPAYINSEAPAFESSMPTPGAYDAESAAKSRQLAGSIRRLADEAGCEFYDASEVANVGDDGCHLDSESHMKLAAKLADIVVSA